MDRAERSKSKPRVEVRYFRSPALLRAWFAKRHAAAREVWVGYHKKGGGEASVTWPESVDEALCFGWIDGVRRRVDERRYAIRFAPRQPGSVWSARNLTRAAALEAAGRMTPAGREVLASRTAGKSRVYSYEQRSVELEEPYASLLAKERAAAAFFATQAPSYRKAAAWFVTSAKGDETRRKRLAKMIALWTRGLTGRERGGGAGSGRRKQVT